jgi:hypothetical protein
MWAKQKAVVRGQGYNLVESLRRGGAEGGTPMGLLNRPVVAVFEEDEEERGIEKVERVLRRVGERVGSRFEMLRRGAFFTWC